jgi:hypothetical protein
MIAHAIEYEPCAPSPVSIVGLLPRGIVRNSAVLEAFLMADDLELVELPEDDEAIVVRSADLREIDVRLFPLNQAFRTRQGLEEFAPGSTSHLGPTSLLLQGLEHEAGIGLDQAGQPTLKRRPQGRSTRIWEDDRHAMATFKVARTQAGDEILALAEDKIVSGVSIEMDLAKNVTEKITRSGQTVRRITRAALTGAAPTYRPTYGDQASVVAIRSQEETGTMAEDTPAAAGLSQEATNAIVAQLADAFNRPLDAIMARLETLQEADRTAIQLPATRSSDDRVELPQKGVWAQTVLRMLTGEIIPSSDTAMRSLDDVITSDNLGVVPPAYLTEIIGVIDASRPFLATTRRLSLPASGMDIKVPIINQRPEVGIQDPEKEEVASRKTLIGTETFSAVSIAGAADISIQLLKRSSPEFLGLFVELLAEAYAIFAEDVALDALANAMGGWNQGDALNPASLSLGAAFIASFDAIRRPPDTIWLSTQAIGEFIDAKATTTNQPLYPGLTASATAAGGITGVISGLRAVHVPTLDDHGAFAIVGPSSGFAWTEDGTYTLQVDVPSKAGRDVGIVGMLWAMPWYPAAFSLYNVAS